MTDPWLSIFAFIGVMACMWGIPLAIVAIWRDGDMIVPAFPLVQWRDPPAMPPCLPPRSEPLSFCPCCTDRPIPPPPQPKRETLEEYRAKCGYRWMF